MAENTELGLEGTQEMMDEIFAVLKQNGINCQLWMQEYLEACAQNGGQTPPDFPKFLPWNMDPAMKDRLSRDSIFQHGNAQFVRTGAGDVFHIEQSGKRTRVDIGSMTWEEFEELTGV